MLSKCYKTEHFEVSFDFSEMLNFPTVCCFERKGTLRSSLILESVDLFMWVGLAAVVI
jgi:hypothetical protein